MIGKTLLHYRIEGKLGQGGMGTVYLAEDTKLGRRVALKLLPEERGSDPDWLERFDREARAVAALNHPNIVILHATERDGDRRFLVMEQVEGVALSELIPKGGLALERFFELAIPIADALSAAHRAGILHRDLKPGNVMVEAEGRPKILDFGLARLDGVDASAVDGDAPTRTLADPLTEPGHLVGTSAYLSPEQAKGDPADARSDLFALGAVYFQMLTGRRAFDGGSTAETLSAVLRDEPEAVHEVKEGLPRHLGRIVRHCLEKDPAKRFQSAAEVRNELEGLREEVLSGEHGAPSGERDGGGRRVLSFGRIGLLVAAVLVLLAFVVWLGRDRSGKQTETSSVAATTDERRSLAVLYFDNLSDDPELDWLRSGLPELLVPELSQAEGLDVLSTDHLYQVLAELGKLDERITSFEVVREIAEEADVDVVVRGSFAKVGNQIRIVARVEELASGKVLETLREDGVGQESLFGMTDRLGRGVRKWLGATAGGDVDVVDVTTSSVEALRLFTRARQLRREYRERESMELNREAVRLDPDFSLAWANLSVAAANRGLWEESGNAIERAFAHRDRLPLVERLRVEEIYYKGDLATVSKALEAQWHLFELDPRRAGAGSVVHTLNALEMYEEAEPPLRELLQLESVHELTFDQATTTYLGFAQPERAEDPIRSYLEAKPESWLTHANLGRVYLAAARYEEAEAAFDRAQVLQPEDGHWDWLRTLIAWNQWSRLEEEAKRLDRANAEPYVTLLAAWFLRSDLEHRGHTLEILDRWRSQILSTLSDEGAREMLSIWLAEIHLLRGEAGEALGLLRNAESADPPLDLPALLGFRINGYYWRSLAEASLGLHEEASQTLERFRSLTMNLPGDLATRIALQLEGELALERGEWVRAIERLGASEALLPPGDVVPWHFYQRFRLWEVKGKAHAAADEPERAAFYFEQMLNAGYERHFDVARWVMAHYRLAAVYETLGRTDDARDLYRRFYETWKDGDLRREWVETAQEKMASL